MYAVRLWSVRHARGLSAFYDAFERVLPRIEENALLLEEQHRREVLDAGLGHLPDRGTLRKQTVA